MLRIAIALVVLTSTAHAQDDEDTPCACDATPAACDSACSCDLECEVDWSKDECAEPDAGCKPEMSDAELEAAEVADEQVEPVESDADPAAVVCPEGATNVEGTCVAMDLDVDSGGCTTGGSAGLLVVIAILVIARRRKLLPIVLIACALDEGGWDDAIDGDADPDHRDVLTADLGDGDGAQYLLPKQTLRASNEPVAQFALASTKGGVPIVRVPDSCGDRLVIGGEGELLGWARTDSGEGTAALVELKSPDGCFVYETDPEAVANRVDLGYTVVQTLGYVWPPGLGDPEPDALAAPAPCSLKKRPATILLYASAGKEETLRFLLGCPGEVIVGEKRESGPVGAMKSPDAKAAGGRTAFVIDRNGEKLRSLLLRSNGTERTAAYIRNKLKHGYDYVVIDEITAHPEFADGATTNRRLRKLLQRIPRNKILPYISIDLTQQAGGFTRMRERKLLLRAFKRRARALALEVYLHTPQVIAGGAPFNFRRAADRLALSVSGLRFGGGINQKAITVIGTSIHAGSSGLAQYMYLDKPTQDLRSIEKQVNALRRGSKRVRQQKGIGYYFVNRSDMAPRPGAPYSYDALIRRLRLQALRFK